MKSTVKALWNGNICPAKDCGVGNSRIEELIVLIEQHKEQLNKELTQQQKDVFEKFVDCTEEYLWFNSECAFCDGFSLACKLMSEALIENA